MNKNANSVVLGTTKIYDPHHVMIPKSYSNTTWSHGNETKSSSQRGCLLKNEEGSRLDLKNELGEEVDFIQLLTTENGHNAPQESSIRAL